MLLSALAEFIELPPWPRPPLTWVGDPLEVDVLPQAARRPATLSRVRMEAIRTGMTFTSEPKTPMRPEKFPARQAKLET
jgi:hypothetical protein